MKQPSWLNRYLSSSDIEAIEKAVSEVEHTTDAEIVPMIVRRSTSVTMGRRLAFWFSFALIALVLGGALALSGTAIVETVRDWVFARFDLWPDPAVASALGLLIELLLALVVFAISRGVAGLLVQIEWFERWLFPVADLAGEVIHRAEFEFAKSDLRRTQRRTGVLIFVSIFERRAVVLADSAFAGGDGRGWNEESQKVVDEVLSKMLEQMKRGRMVDAFTDAIRMLGEHLASVAPAKVENQDELSNRVRILD
ncbi:MAG: hypothetical protein JNJ49_08420 [Bdellovibrionaceae bacterium]|nr:hypothetical protein [Pseudobdellovibrionaceae bacterium]